MFDLGGSVALVTGAASGIGAEVARSLAARGATVAGADLRSGDTPEVCASTHRVDVSDPQAAETCVREITDRHGRLDVLVNSAGIARLAKALDTSIEDWRLTLDVNLTGSWLMAKAAGRVMVGQGYGRIVNLASQAASSGLDPTEAAMVNGAELKVDGGFTAR